MYIRKGTLEWQEVPDVPLVEPSDVIVRPFVAARCDNDIAYLHFDVNALLRIGIARGTVDPAVVHYLGESPFRGPFPFGHECIAEVIECGEDVRRFRPMDKVVVPFQISCGQCRLCRGRSTGTCSAVPDNSLFGVGQTGGDWGGVVADRLRVPFADHMLVHFPQHLDPVSFASLSDNIACGWQAVVPALQAKPGASVLVVGGGAKSIALYAVAAALFQGAERVDYMDTNADTLAPQRFEIAAALGAQIVESSDMSQVREQYAVSVDGTMIKQGLHFAVRSLEPDGVCSSPSVYYDKELPMPLFEMAMKKATLRLGFGNALESIREILARPNVQDLAPEKVTTVCAAWSEAASAFLESSTKVVVHRDPLAA
ncbi:MAG: alcohol dehydrogenase catalytic domain-containing protein [Myxococcales bacterium]|nr:alcohol dehydrogenase catalytic domain-containing protein [Myxococcales bacterium]MDD9966493.1 alcohol dehydrogenase catalytic domain-containing protein [Myxococcales bacterium]